MKSIERSGSSTASEPMELRCSGPFGFVSHRQPRRRAPYYPISGRNDGKEQASARNSSTTLDCLFCAPKFIAWLFPSTHNPSTHVTQDFEAERRGKRLQLVLDAKQTCRKVSTARPALKPARSQHTLFGPNPSEMVSILHCRFLSPLVNGAR